MIKKSIKKLTKKIILALLTILVLGIPLLYLTVLNQKEVKASWYDDNWGFRKAVTVTVASSASDITNLETLLTVDTTGITASLQTNCEDLRFTNQAGKLLPYYAPSCSDNSATNKVWVLLDLVPKNTTTYTLYMYYGNPSATSVSDATKFNLFNGLVGYWAMNEASWNGTASEVKDSSVNSSGGTSSCSGGGCTVPSTTSSKYSNGGSFDGSQDYLSMGNPSALQINGKALTISAWINMSSVPGGYKHVAGRWGNTATTTASYALGINNSNITFYISTTGANYFVTTGTTTLNSSTWYHITGVYDGVNVKVYVNGVTEGTPATATDNIFNPDVNFTSGAYFPSTIGGLFPGQIDDLRVYNRVLSAGEISQLYSNPGTIASTANATTKPSTSFATEEKAPGPTAYWAFDDGTGTNAQDRSSNNNDGTLSGTTIPTWQTEDQCMAGKCLYFDGSTSYVDSGNSSSVQITSNMTISTWVKIPSLPSVSYVIVDKDKDTATASRGYNLAIDSAGQVNFFVSQNAAGDTYTYPEGVAALTPNTWYHIEAVYSAGAYAKIYINGKEDVSVTTSVISSINNSTNNLGIGKRITGTAYPFKGFIDDVKIYPYARTQAQINSDYNSRGSVKGSSASIGYSDEWKTLSNGLTGYWKIDEASGNRSDSSGNGNTLTDTNTVASTTGKFGNGGQFENSPVANNQYLAIADNASVSTGDVDWTIAGWIYMDSKPASNMSIISKDDYVTNKREFNFYWNQVTDRFEWWLGNGVSTIRGTATASSLGAPSLSTWYYVVFWHDSVNDTINIQINNGTVDSAATSGGGGDSAAPFVIGGFNTTGQWDGRIDEVRFYKKVLTSAERTTLYNFAPGPVGYWNFEEGSGTAVKDTSGNANTGTWAGTGTTHWTSGKYGKGGKFNGTDDYVSLPDASIFDITGNTTIGAWVKTTETGTWKQVFVKDDNDNERDYKLQISGAAGADWIADAAMFCINKSGTFNCASSSNTVTDGNWHHIVATFDDSSNTGKIYVDGNLNATNTSMSAAQGTNNNVESIGAVSDATFPFNGQIDEVKVFNYTLTPTQVKTLYNNGAVSFAPSSGTP